jgi:Zn-finger nucleic acid-binding protein
VNCSNCGAPLPATSNICVYCETLNEVDLRTVRKQARSKGTGERSCPRCSVAMSVLAVPGLAVEVDRCGTCHGIFFDPQELETALDHATRARTEIDRERLTQLVEEERKSDHDKIRYVPCPDCGQMMNRKAYGAKSGVVIDWCKDHGVWLDGGELAHLVKWARAGGRDHDRSVRAEAERIEARQKAAREALAQVSMQRWSTDEPRQRTRTGGWGDVFDALDMIGGLLFRR